MSVYTILKRTSAALFSRDAAACAGKSPASRGDSGMTGEDRSHATGPGEDLIARYGGGTWDDVKGYTPNWSDEERRSFMDHYGEEDAVGMWMQMQDDIMHDEAKLAAAGWTDHERKAFTELFDCDPIEIPCAVLLEEMRERLTARDRKGKAKSKKKKSTGPDDWLVAEAAANLLYCESQ